MFTRLPNRWQRDSQRAQRGDGDGGTGRNGDRQRAGDESKISHGNTTVAGEREMSGAIGRKNGVGAEGGGWVRA